MITPVLVIEKEGWCKILSFTNSVNERGIHTRDL